MVPKLSFKVAKVEEYLDVLTFFILNNDRWKENIFTTYPFLKDRLEKSENPSQDILTFFNKQDGKFLNVMQEVTDDFNESWSKINDPIMQELEKINETRWGKDTFTARITLNPICPRYLKENTFDLYFGMAERTMRTICLHELSHFIFFKKFKEVFPEVNEEEFESPHLIWKLSEILPTILCNTDEINNIFEVQEEVLVYDSIKKLEINNRRVVDILKEIYDTRDSFQDFIRKSYSFMKEHEKEINF